MTKSRAIAFMVSFIASLVCFAFILMAFERSATFELFNAICMSTAVGVVVGFSQAAWYSMREPYRTLSAADVLILGVWILWVGLLIAFGNLWAYRLTGDTYWLNNGYSALSRWLIFVGGSLHLAASGAIENRIPPKAYVRTGVIVAFGVAVALFLIGLGID